MFCVLDWLKLLKGCQASLLFHLDWFEWDISLGIIKKEQTENKRLLAMMDAIRNKWTEQIYRLMLIDREWVTVCLERLLRVYTDAGPMVMNQFIHDVWTNLVILISLLYVIPMAHTKQMRTNNPTKLSSNLAGSNGFSQTYSIHRVCSSLVCLIGWWMKSTTWTFSSKIDKNYSHAHIFDKWMQLAHTWTSILHWHQLPRSVRWLSTFW